VAEFVEVQSAKRIEDRPELKKAIALCQKKGYTLAIAKIDRLSRTTEDALAIYSRLDGRLYSCDIPTEKGARMDKFTLTIFMAIADRERELISIRTKQALDVKLEQVGEWRNPQLDMNSRRRGSESNLREAVREYRTVKGYASLLREQGLSYKAIADRLSEEGHTTRRGKAFKKMTVKRLLDR